MYTPTHTHTRAHPRARSVEERAGTFTWDVWSVDALSLPRASLAVLAGGTKYSNALVGVCRASQHREHRRGFEPGTSTSGVLP
eukprot:6463021-Amphidinium_carterae.1